MAIIGYNSFVDF